MASIPPSSTPIDDHTPLTPDERNAMRAYLQRSEVRLSTLHRIAVAFISGAGLLFLFPMFFKDEIVTLIRVFLAHISEPIPVDASSAAAVRLFLYACVGYPFLLSFSIPVYSMYILIKDVVHFYFTIYAPGFPHSLITPSFALSGISFSPDESPQVKKRVFESQYKSESINFAIPFSKERREQYFDETIRTTDGAILPKSRGYDGLVESGVIDPSVNRVTVERLNAAFGLARTLDRQLVEEVATTELSLVRHILYLRRLVLRYVRTLLMLIWTALITFLMLPFLEGERFPTMLVLAIGYSLWAGGVVPIMRTPLAWIYRHTQGIPDKNQIDRQLTLLETQVRPFVYGAMLTSAAALVLAGAIYLP
ncbi:MAG: hypothetical protein SF162_09300 [bacterium]|nr:hypothetical protein [bacterium]